MAAVTSRIKLLIPEVLASHPPIQELSLSPRLYDGLRGLQEKFCVTCF